MGPNLLDVIDQKLWQDMQDSFSTAAGAPIFTLDNRGNVVAKSGGLPFYCKIIKKNAGSSCSDNLRNMLSEEVTRHKCFAGMTCLVSPVDMNDNVLGWIVVGPMLENREIDLGSVSGAAKIDADELKDALDEIKHSTEEESRQRELLIKVMAGIMLKACSGKRLADAAREKTEVINAVMRSANSGLNLEESCRNLIPSIVRALSLEGCSVNLASGGRYCSGSVRGDRYSAVESAVLDTIRRTGHFFFVSGIASEFSFGSIRGIAGMDHALLSVPMSDDGKLLGVLNLYYPKGDGKGKSEIRFLHDLAGQVAIVVSNAAKYRHVQKDSTTDSLTGVYNKAYFMEFLKKEIEKGQRKKSPVSLIMMDIDDFKHYNDTNGHVEGDRLLKEMGVILQEHVRAGDVAGRYGGEEFVILLPETKQEYATVVAERIRTGISGHKFPFMARQPLGIVSVSAGVASCLNSSLGPEEMVAMADKAMYVSKQEGKNMTRTLLCIDKSMSPIDVQTADTLYKSENSLG